MIRRPPRSTLFPSPPLFRSAIDEILHAAIDAAPARFMHAWKVYVLQGASRDVLVDKVCAAHDAIYADPALAASCAAHTDRKSTRLNSSHQIISYAVFCLKKK